MNEKINRKQKNILKEMTNFIGNFEIKDEQIFCYVNYYMLNSKNNINKCIINVSGISSEIFNEDLLKENNLLDKKINYVFSNMWFHSGLCINSTENSVLHFKNCTFTDYIQIDNADMIVFNNNEYCTTDNNKFIILSENIDNNNCIMFDDEKFNHSNENMEMNIDISAKNIVINNSIINESNNIKLSSENLYMKETKIISNELEVYTDKIICDNSNEINSRFIIVENSSNDYDFLLKMNYDSLFFNGNQLGNNIDYNEEKYEFMENVSHLADALRNVYGLTKYNMNEKLDNIENEMLKQNFVKILKK